MDWKDVETHVRKTAAKLKGFVGDIKAAVRDMPNLATELQDGVYWSTKQSKLVVVARPSHVRTKLAEKLGAYQQDWQPTGYPDDGEWIKVAYAPALRDITDSMNLTQGSPLGIQNNPSPLASILTSGILGAGLGYGAGWLGEHLLPYRWQRGNMRKSLMLAGAGLGMTPGLMWGGANKLLDRDFNDPSLMEGERVPQIEKTGEEWFNNYTGAVPRMDLIPVNEFNQVLWTDPRVADRLPLPMRTAATGLVSGAAQMSGSARLITPRDIGIMAAGMGSGYAAGSLVGKGLGLLFGMPKETQEMLKNTGMFAGVVSQLVPIAFGQ